MWLSAGSNAENLAVADGSHNIFRKNLASLSWDRIFVAATRAEMEQLRSDFRVYGEVGWGWKPYSSEAPAGIFAQKISLTEGFRYQASQIGDDLMQRLEEADRSNTIVIIVVDPWSLRLPKYADFMSDYDKRAFLNCGVIILWDAKDDETTAHRAALEQTVLRRSPGWCSRTHRSFSGPMCSRLRSSSGR